MRFLTRVFLVLLLLAIVYLAYGRWVGGDPARVRGEAGASGSPIAVDTERARERGAELGEKAATAAARVEASVGDAALTTKIKAKMALDDSVRARAIDVSTTGSTVTVSGTVRSNAERDRALTLARETEGIARVIDHLVVR